MHISSVECRLASRCSVTISLYTFHTLRILARAHSCGQPVLSHALRKSIVVAKFVLTVVHNDQCHVQDELQECPIKSRHEDKMNQATVCSSYRCWYESEVELKIIQLTSWYSVWVSSTHSFDMPCLRTTRQLRCTCRRHCKL